MAERVFIENLAKHAGAEVTVKSPPAFSTYAVRSCGES
jgi:hypothetical protein